MHVTADYPFARTLLDIYTPLHQNMFCAHVTADYPFARTSLDIYTPLHQNMFL